MKRFLVFTTVLTLAVARPELYKEQEDFQFSRSSSDDGTKSGFYGAQRGNMGGNYERAHNMDSLAQNQMSGLVRQVDGELGDGAQTKTGSVYSAANSRGTYGSGHYDLSNLAGRNFHEGTSFDNSHSQSSSSLTQSSSARNRAAYSSSSQRTDGSRSSGYQRVHDAQTQTDDLQLLDNRQTSNLYDYGQQASHSTGYQSNSGFQERTAYDGSNVNSHSGYGSNVRSRLITATPVRIVITPGGRVAIPVAAQTYGTTHGSSAFDQNALTSEAETLSENNQDSVNRPEAKHYESSYRYHKKWEKHDTIPATISLTTPTESSIPLNSELYEDSEARRVNNQYDSRGANAQNAHLSSASGKYNGVKSTSSQSRYQSNYNAQQNGESSNSNAYTQTGYNARNHGVSADSLNAYNTDSRYHGISSASNLNAQTGYNAGSHSDLNSQVEDLNTKPKSYQSSYSYHKSWERQGDPYIIKPASSGYYDGQSSQRLTSATKNHGSATYHAGSHYGQDLADCDENGHIRVARSYNTDTEDMTQESEDSFGGLELGQQVQNTWQNLADLDQSQSDWDQRNDGQQIQNKWDNLQDFGPQSQNNFDQQNVGQQSQNKWDNLQDFGQQSQSDYDQQNVGQQSQSKWENLEDLGQQSTNNWGQKSDLGQQSEDHQTWDKLEDITQQQQRTNDNIENLGQQSQNFLGEHDQDYATQVIIQSQHDDQQPQKEQELGANTPDLHSQTGKEYVEQLHTIESPWDKFDLVDSNVAKVTTEQNKLNVDHKTESNEFYWHQIRNNGGLDQQSNNFEQESDDQNNNYDMKPTLGKFGDNLEQSEGNVAFDNNNNKHYSYSNGFANPSLYSLPISANQNTYQASAANYGIQSLNSHSNSYTPVNWQQHESNAESNTNINNFQIDSPHAPLLSFWGKLDNIEKESLFTDMKNPKRDETYQKERNFDLTDSNDTKIIPALEYQPLQSTMLKEFISDIKISKDIQTETSTDQENKTTTQPEYQTVLPQTHTKPMTSAITPNGKELENSEVPERPQDIGRGDIGPQDLYSTSVILNKPDKNNNELQQNIYNNNKVSYSDLTVLSIEEQKAQQDKNLTGTLQNHNKNGFIDQQKQNKHGYNNIETLTHDNQNHSENQEENMEQQNVILAQQSAENFEQISQQHDKIEQQNHYFQWQNMPNIEQENVNLEQHTNKEQDRFPEFVQQNENLEQQLSNTFEQQNVQDTETLNLKGMNWDIIEQDFEHKTYSQEQQNINEFEKNNVFLKEQDLPNVQNSAHEFDQQNTNLEQQNQFSQEQVSNFGQQDENLQQQNINTFEIERAQNIGQEVQSFHQTDLQVFSHNHDIQDFKLQKEHIEQQSLHSFEQHSEKTQNLAQLDKLHEKPDFSRNNLQHQAYSGINEAPVMQTVYNNAQANSPANSQMTLTESHVEPVIENAGFWKSVGNKFSNAKNKVVSWFSSN